MKYPTTWVIPPLSPQTARLLQLSDSQQEVSRSASHLHIARAVSPLRLPRVAANTLPGLSFRDIPVEIDFEVAIDSDSSSPPPSFSSATATATATATANVSTPSVRVCLPPHVRALLPPPLAAALLRLAAAHAHLSGARRLRASVVVVKGTPCPKWHVDRVRLRGVCTLLGPGTELWDRAEDRAVPTAAGDFLFIGGAGTSGADEDTAVVHRSPHMPDGATRIMVQTDCYA